MQRPLPLLGLVLTLSATAAAQCHAFPQETKKTVPWAGNTGEIRWQASQFDCNVDKNVPWVAIVVTPPTSSSSGVLRYSVDTNLSSAPRTTNIQMGDATIEISQDGGPRPGMAFSPGRIELQFSPAANAPKEITKPLFVGSDEPLTFTAKPVEPADWLKVVAANSGPQRQQTFMVTVKTDQLKPGTNKANIQIEAPGASNVKETIPVIVQVGAAAPAAK